MKSGSFLLARKNGFVLSIVGVLLVGAGGRGTLPEVLAQAAPSQNTDSVAHTVEGVDEPVQIITVPEPRYPKVLKDSLITARIVLQYIVDTKGHAEPNSFRVLEHVETNTDTTHESFIEAAKKAILKSTFKPARFRGRPVRQLVEQRIRFNIRP